VANLGQFRTRISLKVGLDNSPGGPEQLAIDGWVNEGVVDVLMETQVYVTEAVGNLTPGVGDMVLDPKVLVIKDVYVTSDSIQYILEKVSPDAIIQRRASTNIATGPARLYSLNGANNLMIWPAPQTGDSLTFWYVPRPTALQNASDDPSMPAFGGIPTEWHKAIEWYALWQAGDYADDSSSSNGQSYQQTYEGWLKRVKKERSYKGGRYLGAITAGRRKRPFRPHDPSTDTGYFYG
jgi:hypothetical protein